MAQLGQSARLGAVRSQVRILLPRFITKFLQSSAWNLSALHPEAFGYIP